MRIDKADLSYNWDEEEEVVTQFERKVDLLPAYGCKPFVTSRASDNILSHRLSLRHFKHCSGKTNTLLYLG